MVFVSVRLLGRIEVGFPDSICLDEGLADFEAVLQFEELYQCLLEFAISQARGEFYWLATHWVDAGVPHACGEVGGKWAEELAFHTKSDLFSSCRLSLFDSRVAN